MTTGPERDRSGIAGGSGADAGLDDRAATGSDTSAGVATKVLALVLLPVIFPWEVTRRIVTKGIPAAAQMVRAAAVAASKALGRGVGRAWAAAAFLGHGLGYAIRPVGDLTAACRRIVSGGSRLIGSWVGAGGRAVGRALGVLIRSLAGPARLLMRAAARAAEAVVSCARAVRQLLIWLLRPVARAVTAAVRAGAAVVGALGKILAILGTGLLSSVRAFGALLGAVLQAVGHAVRPAAVLVADRAVVACTFVAACCEWVWRGVAACCGWVWRGVAACCGWVWRGVAACCGWVWRGVAACCRWVWSALAGASARVWAVTCWAWRQLLSPLINSVGSALRFVLRAIAAVIGAAASAVGSALAAVGRVLRGCLRPLISGLRVVRTKLVALDVQLGRAASSVATMIGRLIVAVTTPIGRALRRLAKFASQPFRIAGGAITAMPRAFGQSARVAFGTARHQARSAALAASTEESWRAAILPQAAQANAAPGVTPLTFTAECFQNPCMPPGAARVSAVISVAAESSGLVLSDSELVEVILVDCSASMAHPWEKIRAARDATRAAVDRLRDGVWFAIVRGAESADVAYPPRGGLVQASAETKRAAAKAIGSLQPVGGTAIGRWLTLAADLTSLRPGAMCHAMLLTDGKDEDESQAELDAALARCAGLFQCDCRGIGTDWAVSELRKVSTALLGSLDIISEPTAMADDFRLMTEAAMARQLDAALRVWTPEHATTNFLKQVSPTIVDLMPTGRPAGPLTADYRTGAWGTERREYHLSVDVRPGSVGAEMLAARVSVVVQNRVVAKALVKATWTDDEILTAALSPEVAHYDGQAELASAIQEGLEARRSDDEAQAAALLGRAVQLAAASGNDAIGGLLANVVDIIDAHTGTVRLKKQVRISDEMTLDTRSTKTVRLSQRASAPDTGSERFG